MDGGSYCSHINNSSKIPTAMIQVKYLTMLLQRKKTGKIFKVTWKLVIIALKVDI